MESITSLRKQNNTPYILKKEVQHREVLLTTHKHISPTKNSFVSPYIPTQPKQRHSLFLRILIGTLIIIIIIGLILFGYFSWKIGSVTSIMNIGAKHTIVTDTLGGARSFVSPIFITDNEPLRGETDGRTNILLLGKANEGSAGQHLTDTIMIASINFSQKKIALLSLPRDIFMPIPDENFSTKINAIYQYDLAENGSNRIKKTVSEITGLPIHYFGAIDYDGFKHIIDTIGGISIYVERNIFDSRYPGPNYSYETFKLSKGWQDLDGETALKYVRERHSDPDGDFGRARRQHAAISAVRNKMFSLQILLNPITLGNIIDTLGTHIRTDFSLPEIQRLLSAIKEIDTKNVQTTVVDAWKKDSLLRVSHVQIGSVAMFTLVPRTGNWNEVHDLANNIFDMDQAKERKKMIAQERASITIVNASNDPSLTQRVQDILSLEIPEHQIHIMDTSENIVYNQENSIIIDRNNQQTPFTFDMLQKKFDLKKTELDITPQFTSITSTDIIVVLGDDIAKKLFFSKDAQIEFQNIENDPEYQKKSNEALLLQHK